VVALGFMQTTIMEMGQPPPAQSDPPAQWLQARQYTREFPYLWDEMHIPISYDVDRGRAEQVLLDAARRHTQRITELSRDAMDELLRRFVLKEPTELEPRAYWRLTDNWLELTVRFIAEETGVRGLKDRISRDVLAGFDAAGLGLASGTYEIVGIPPVRIVHEDGAPAEPNAAPA
jgi:hypothetical protein